MEQEIKENQAFEYAKVACMDYMVHPCPPAIFTP